MVQRSAATSTPTGSRCATAAGRRPIYDPKTKQFTLIDTCFSTHHLQFDNDPDETVVFQRAERPDLRLDRHQGLRPDPRRAESRSAGADRYSTPTATARSPGPCNVMPARPRRRRSMLYDTDTPGGAVPAGAARARGHAHRRRVLDPKLDTMVSYSLYSMIPSPVDDSVWGVSRKLYPGYAASACSAATILRKPARPSSSRFPRRATIRAAWTSTPTAWSGPALAATSHLASFDVRKCKDLNGPAKIDGSQCKEGWTLYQTTGPKLKGTDVPADFHYYNWVDQHNVIGLGANTPFATGSNSDSLIALESADEEVDLLPRPLSARLLLARHGCSHRRSERRAGKAVRSTRTTAPISSGTSKAERAPRARS